MNLKNIDIEEIKKLALSAGVAIMKIYKKDFEIEIKEDNSPLTEADKKSNEIICSKLKELYPEIPIISEENREISYQIRKNWDYCWLIDPIDGTKEFIKRNGEFTVNIALVYKNRPILGVVYAPVLNDLYWAKEGEGAFKNGKKLPLYKNLNPTKELKVVASKSHLSKETQDFINNLETENIILTSIGSSLKFCKVAEGKVDIYPRLAPTMEWDTCASDIVVQEAGKRVLEFYTKESLIYNKKDLLNPYFIVK